MLFQEIKEFGCDGDACGYWRMMVGLECLSSGFEGFCYLMGGMGLAFDDDGAVDGGDCFYHHEWYE